MTKTFIHVVHVQSIIEEMVLDKFGCLSMKIDSETAKELGEYLLEEYSKLNKGVTT